MENIRTEDGLGEGEFRVGNNSVHHSSFNTEWISNPKVIIDIGAWDFGDSIRFRLKWPEARVIAMELLPDNYKRYAEFAKSFDVETHNIAMCNKCGEAKFFEAKHDQNHNAQSSLLPPTQSYILSNSYVKHTKTEYTVPCSTLEQFCIDNLVQEIDFLHMDVEGAEWMVIEGFGNLRPKHVFLESLYGGSAYVGQKTTLELENIMYGLGYKLAARLPNDLFFRYS